METTSGKVKYWTFQKANTNGQERRWECISVLNAFLFFLQPGKERSTAYFLRIISNSVIALQVALKQPDSKLDNTNFPQRDRIKLKNCTPDSQPGWTKRKSGLGLFNSKERKIIRKQTSKKVAGEQTFQRELANPTNLNYLNPNQCFYSPFLMP